MGNNSARQPTNDHSAEASHAVRSPPALPQGEANQFIQALLHHNEELGFIPQRVLEDGRRTICKADMKKTRAVDLPFDLLESSIKLDRANFDGSRLRIKFTYTSKTTFECSLLFGCSGKRSATDAKGRPDFIHMSLLETIPLEEGLDKLADSTISINSSKLFYTEASSEDSEYFDLVINFRKKVISGISKEITDLYVYCQAERSTGNAQSMFKLTCVKKGSLRLPKE